MRTATRLRPRTKAPEERRDELMNAAQRLFLEQGVATTTVEQITIGADVAKGTFYLHFSSKDDLLAALRERFSAALLSNVQTAVARQPQGEWRKKLASWANGYVAGYLDSIRLHDAVFYESRPPTRKGSVDNRVVDDLAALLQAGVTAQAWSIDDPRFMAVFLFSGLHSAVDHAYMKEKRVNRSRLAQKAEQLFFRTVGLPPE
ncbi:TetR/AcrR family transcriptional regulator [Paraburkholderia phenazinium]|jgi:AcrR family transcriptional regulator|uniref:DNA-binding transcriptional regulator, AcrR family n=1 Tax=Paraburkholderia phenazinium TaxID=60549 RepID=A0A1G8ICP3_9BURK|nr:TetR/AcrR family transcriptional regulator [Paraburkholderia phenazinium]SDI16666.1 DNA-binding transcriptional regulator, AcrR family [Paraburkholderia phenazinium]